MQQISNTGNVARLAIAQALSMTTMNVNIINTALVGSLLAPVAWFATLGLSLQFVASMLTTLPASLLMVRFGRRPVFIGGVLIAAVAACLQGIAIIIDHFVLFCAASMALGIAHGCASFYRYAATDCATEEDRPKAISYVLAGGLMAALFGPEIARNTVEWVPEYLYAGCYFSVSAVQLISLLALAGVKIPKPTLTLKGGRPMGMFYPQSGICCGHDLRGHWLCPDELFYDSDAIAGGECGPAWHICQCNDYSMACCRDVRAVFFHRQFNSTVRHNQNFVSWVVGLYCGDGDSFGW